MNAPGSEKTITFLPANRSSVVTVAHSPLRRIRKATSGTVRPSWLGRICSAMAIGCERKERTMAQQSARPAQPMWRPPLTEKSAPVAKPDSSDATQDTIEAMSCGVPSRLTGMPETILSRTSWRIALTMSVAM